MWRQEEAREELNHKILAKSIDTFGAPRQKRDKWAQPVSHGALVGAAELGKTGCVWA